MSTLASDTPRGNPYKRRLLGGAENISGYVRLKTIGEIGALAVAVPRAAFTPPFRWWRDAFVEMSLAFRRSAIPMVLSHSIYALGFGLLLFGDIVQNLGLPERHASVISIFWSRELATWITGMIFAGIVGSAITADLGARKIREELDALAVLGVKQMRSLIVPRVIACTVGMPALALLGILIAMTTEFIFAPGFFDITRPVLLDALVQNITATDILISTVLKTTILGFFVGVVACYKGISAGGGADGVGRAVNQTVVITFFGIWFFNAIFNYAYFTTFPDAATFRG